MTATLDDLAGVVDLFDGLTRAELAQALVELGARRGDTPDEDAIDATIQEAVDAYYLVRYEETDEELLVTGPAAFPTLPDHAEDLPHTMEVSDRSLDRDDLGDIVADRLRADADAAIDAGDTDRVESLIDISYDVEAWALVDLGGVRDRLDEHATTSVE